MPNLEQLALPPVGENMPDHALIDQMGEVRCRPYSLVRLWRRPSLSMPGIHMENTWV